MGTAKVELAQARKLALEIRRHIRPALDRCEVAGSIRRGKPQVGDIELCGIPADPQRLCRLLAEVGQPIKPGCPGREPWPLKPGAKYMRLWLPQLGCNLDLFLANPHNWGGIYLMRTGSGADSKGNAWMGFVPGCFSRWKQLSGGGRMLGGQPQLPSGEVLSVPEEAALFQLLQMRPPPPEERVDRRCIKRYAEPR